MKTKSFFFISAAAVISLAAFSAVFLSACAKDEKETVSVALWGDQLMENYAPWLQEQFPDVDFDFHSATNATDYYNFLSEKDELPDILTVRRFSLRDVEGIKDQLMDLSDTDLAAGYYQAYLHSYTYSDGVVNWLPASAEIDDIIINKTLFEENNIPIPTDYDSFLSACELFRELGIQGYVTDFWSDYTCMETLQGFSAEALNSAEGVAWRQEYESGNTNQLDPDVWLPVFEKTLEVLKANDIGEDNMELRGGDIGADFTDGKLAMFRGTVQYMNLYGEQYEKLILPYPGDTDESSFYLTYPVFQAAAKKTDDKDRQELILEILTAMLSEDGLNHIIPGESLVAYSRDVEIDLDESIQNMKPYIDDNRLFIRLASADMFSVSQAVVQKMLTGEILDAQSALDEFNRMLKENEAKEEQPVVAHVDKAYSRIFTAEHGNQAASALLNTMREELGVDLLIGSSGFAGSNIYEGDYTARDLNYLVNWESSDMRLMQLTGDEIREFVSFYLGVSGTRDSACNDYTLPVSSGFEMKIRKDENGYSLEDLTINGEPIESDKTYSFISWDTWMSNYVDVVERSGFPDYERIADSSDALISQRLVEEGGQLSEPTDYIELVQ